MADGDATYTLDDGTVVYDLTTITGDENENINGAFFTIEQPDGSSGTGLIQSFVRLQGTGTEDGYNTSLRPIAAGYELNTSLSFTHDLRLGDVPIVDIGGTLYYEFLLDINQTNNNPLLSLDKLQVYTSATDRSDAVTSGAFQANTDLVFDLDGNGANNSILLDYSLQSGSGAADLYFYVPVTDFAGADEDTFVILYSAFGELGTIDAFDEDGAGDIDDDLYGSYATNDGFEEWAVSKESEGQGITGFKWEDENGNGTWDAGEQALSGWRFDYSYTIGNGANAVLYEGSAITNADGQYFIPVVGSNQNYTITITEFQQDGWANTYDGDATANGQTTIVIQKDLANLPSGDLGVTEPLNFGNFEEFSISGTKFIDVNGDGDLGPEDDQGYGGVRIFVDINGNNVFDNGIDPFDFTDPDGTWTIDGLDQSAGGKFVLEVVTDDFVQTLGPVDAIVAESGEDIGGFDFANFELFNISGYKWIDTNGDSIWDEGEQGKADWTIYLDYDADGDGVYEETFSDTTDADGKYEFGDLGPGSYRVREDETDTDWVVTSDGMIEFDGASGVDRGGEDGEEGTFNFGNFQLYDISGTKFIDVNGNGDLDPEDNVGLVNVTIYIERDGIAGLTAGDESTTTDDDGNWSFTNLDWTYAGQQVFEVLPDGYVQTLGEVGYTITGTSGTDQTDLDFANFELFDISGYKWVDTDGDSIWDEGEQGKADWTIYLDYDADGDGVYEETFSDTTDADGKYEFGDLGPGSYRVREDETDTDWVVTSDGMIEFDGASGVDRGGEDGEEGTFNFGNFQLYDISGTKFIDVNGNGDLDPEDNVGLVNVTIYIERDGIAGLTAGDESTTTDDDGNWSFTNLDWTYAGQQVFEVLPDGYVQTLGEVGYTITGTSGTDQTDLDFANFELFDISGYKWVDTDGDSIWDEGEQGKADWTIYLDYDADGDGVYEETFSDTTDADGKYEFGDLGPGSYRVREDETDTDWVVTSDGMIEFDGASGVDRGGEDGEEGTFNFGNFQLYDISGTKFIDVNGNGDLDPEDNVGLVNVTIYIERDGIAGLTAGDESTTTDDDGNWSFTNLDWTYAGQQVFEVLPDGYVQTLGEVGYTITGTSGTDQTDLDFANFELFDISGYKWVDTNGDSIWDEGEPGKEGWTINLEYDSDGDGVVDATISTQTDENGYYEFLDLGPGPYEVSEDETVAGWSKTYGPTVVIAGASGVDREGEFEVTEELNFGNFQDMVISGYKWADANGNSLWDESDAATLAGWTIVLDIDTDPENGNELATAVTGVDGSYVFTIDYSMIEDLGVSTLFVYEQQQDGFTQTFGNFSFDIESGLVIAGELGEEDDGNFGNQMMGGANRTPGFWQSTLGQSFYDGNPNNQGDANGPKPGGAEGKDFEAEGWSEQDLLLLYGKDTDANGSKDRFEIWGDGDSSMEAGEIFLTPTQLLSWVSGGPKGGGRDYVQILERDLGAAYLNSLNNDAIGDAPGGSFAIDPSIEDYYADAVQFIFAFDNDFNGMASGTKKAQQDAWNAYGSDAHNVLGAFNESGDGMVGMTMMQVLMDGDDFASPLVKGYIATVNELEAEAAMFASAPVQDELAIHTSSFSFA